MAEDRVSLRQAMRNYSATMRSNKAKYGKGQGSRKWMGMVGDEMQSAAKYYKSSIEPNVKAWKDIEAGYDELGIAEDKRWGDGKAPGFFQKMQSPEHYEIPDVVSGDYEYSAGSLQALGKATRSPKADQLLALTKSDKTDFAQLFAVGKTEAASSITNPNKNYEGPVVDTTNIANPNTDIGTLSTSKDDWKPPTMTAEMRAKIDADTGGGTGSLETPKSVNESLTTLESNQNINLKKTNEPSSAETNITESTTSGMDIDKNIIPLEPEELTWQTDKLFKEYWKESQSNVIFSSPISDTQMEINYNAWKKTNAK